MKDLSPERIEALSFSIIEEGAPAHNFSEHEWEIVKRVVHATADFDFIKNMRFHPKAITSGINALKKDINIIYDTKMALYGTYNYVKDKKLLCFIDDPDVLEKNKITQKTRASLAIEKAKDYLHGAIVVIGNAPTALFTLLEIIKIESIIPSLIVGVPVGFVGAKEAKDELLNCQIPFITTLGPKGGTPVAVAIINALVKLRDKSEKSEK